MRTHPLALPPRPCTSSTGGPAPLSRHPVGVHRVPADEVELGATPAAMSRRRTYPCSVAEEIHGQKAKRHAAMRQPERLRAARAIAAPTQGIGSTASPRRRTSKYR